MDNYRLNLQFDEIVNDFKQNLIKDLVRWTKVRTPSELFDFEQELLKSLNDLHSKIFGGVLNEIHRDTEFVGKCQSDAQTEYEYDSHDKGWGTVSLWSLKGKTRIRTPYFSPFYPRRIANHSSKRAGIYPVLRRLGIIRNASPRFVSEICRQMTDGPSTIEAIERLGTREIHISKKKLQNTVRDFASVALWQRQASLRNFIRTKRIDKGRLCGKRVVLGIDGGRIRIRVNRIKDGESTSKSYTTKKCEAKLFAIYSIDEKGDKEQGKNIFYDGTIQSSEYLFDLLELRLMHLGIYDAQVLAIVADGAPWIWNGVAKLRKYLSFGKLRIIEIIDWAHAVGKLSIVSKIGINFQAKQQLWFKRARRMLKNGDFEKLIKTFSELDSSDDRENCIINIKKYFQTHRFRMQYPKFRKEGLPIGSGVIESGIRRIVNMRLHGATIFWRPDTAEQILYLRCQLKSGQWNNFVKSEIEQWALEMAPSLIKTFEVNDKIVADYHKSHPPQLVSHKRSEVINWAQKMLKSENVLILDTETTGLDNCDEIIQLSIINTLGHTCFHMFFQPMTTISDEAIAVHGITEHQLVTAPNFADIYENLQDILCERDIIAYNAEFDKRMIEQTCKKYGLEPLDQLNWHCLMEKYAFFVGRRRKNGTYIPYSLKSACEQQGLSIKKAHDAVNDCFATLELLKTIKVSDPL